MSNVEGEESRVKSRGSRIKCRGSQKIFNKNFGLSFPKANFLFFLAAMLKNVLIKMHTTNSNRNSCIYECLYEVC